MRIAVFGVMAILACVTAFTSSEDSQDLAEGYGATGLPITDICKYAVDTIRQKIIAKAQQKALTSAIVDLWDCLGDDEILMDAYAACDILGDLFKNFVPPHLQEAKDYFLEQQTLAACGLCDQAADYLRGFSNDEIDALVEWAATRVEDPNMASSVQEHGHTMLRLGLEALYPQEICSDLGRQCEAISLPKVPKKLVAFVKEILKNVTPCAECKLCEIAVLFAQSHILPNPKLSQCLQTFAIDNLCGFFNKTLAGIGDKGYDLCLTGVHMFTNDTIEALWTFTDSSTVCGTTLKVCNSKVSDNILECICDKIKVPSWANWALPCHWKYAM